MMGTAYREIYLKKAGILLLLFAIILSGCTQQGNEFFDKGRSALKKKLYDDAITYFNQALAEVYYNRGLAHKLKGNSEQAINDFTKAISGHPNHADAYYNRGLIYMRRGNPNQAISDFGKAISNKSDSAEAYYNRGVCLYRIRNVDQAISDFSEAIRIKFKYRQAYLARAMAYFTQKDYDKSWKDVNRVRSFANSVDPQFVAKLQEASGRRK